MVIGLTGGIATGKSTVAEMFRRLGAVVVSADRLAREAVAPGSATLQQLVTRFGAGILLPDGTLDRKALADLIFADPEARGDLNRITHPAIAALAEKRLAELSRQGDGVIVYEAPLLFEAGAERRVDRVVVVRIDAETQLRRLIGRDGISEAQARARVAAQMPQEEKIARADYVIDNSGTEAATAEQVRDVYRLLAEQSAPPGPSKNSR